jgi:hypothetical protein
MNSPVNYLTKLSVSKIYSGGWEISYDELKRISKETVVAERRYYPRICLERQRRGSMKNLSQYSR